MKKMTQILSVAFLTFSLPVLAQENAGLKLPEGFKANLYANNIGGARHIAITKSGVVFAKLRSFYTKACDKSCITTVPTTFRFLYSWILS